MPAVSGRAEIASASISSKVRRPRHDFSRDRAHGVGDLLTGAVIERDDKSHAGVGCRICSASRSKAAMSGTRSVHAPIIRTRTLFARSSGRSFLMKRFKRPNGLRTSSGRGDQFSAKNENMVTKEMFRWTAARTARRHANVPRNAAAARRPAAVHDERDMARHHVQVEHDRPQFQNVTLRQRSDTTRKTLFG